MATRRLPVQELEQRNVAGNSLLSSRYLSRRQRYLIVWQCRHFLTDHDATTFDDFNRGFPHGVDWRNIRGIAITPQGDLFAAAQFGLYRYSQKAGWQAVRLPLQKGEKLSDITTHGDTLIVIGRSCLYYATSPYRHFNSIILQAPEEYNGKVSLFRTIWLLHSGELFGTAGKLVMDTLAVILIILSVSGIFYWFLPKYIRRMKQTGRSATTSIALLKTSLSWHDKIGRTTIVLTLFIALTGWCLRPPILLALVYGRIPAIPFTQLDSPNAWNDKLRMLRYDEKQNDWLLATSEGFYSLKSFQSTPVKISKTPPVSVMGINVLKQDKQGNWLTGSFSGMYVWNRHLGNITDFFTGKQLRKQQDHRSAIMPSPDTAVILTVNSVLPNTKKAAVLHRCLPTWKRFLCRYGTLPRKSIPDAFIQF